MYNMNNVNNLNSKEMLEMINKLVITHYAERLKDIKTRNIKLFKAFPFTGAPDLSEAVTITMFLNLDKLLSEKYNFCNN